jgi:magnesium-protoporphyrin IX monomethyl ester (oxidative) cyclase
MPGYTAKRKIRRILLVRPPLTIESDETKSLVCPLGLGYLAAVLEKDYEIKILDCLAEGFNNDRKEGRFLTYGLNLGDVRERIRDFGPDIVGVSCLFSMQFSLALSICQISKEIDENIITVMGGAHPSGLPQETLENAAVDFVVIGEAEESFTQLIEALNQGAGLSLIDGLGYKDNNRVVINPKTRYIQDLDTIPFPARHLLPMEKYFRVNLPHALDPRYCLNTNIITSRGCPTNCLFCCIHSLWGNDYRVRSPENVLEEMMFLKRNYGIKEIQFEDDNLTLNKNRAIEIFQGMVERKLDMSWSAPNGIALWTLDKELLKLMRKSGCYWLAVAVESGNQGVLNKVIKKPLQLEEAKPLIKEMLRLKIRVTTFFVVGFPGEGIAQIKDTIRFGLSIPTHHLSLFFATPLAGSELYKISKERGLLRPDFNFSNLKTTKVNITPQDLSCEALQKLVARALILFFLREFLRRPHAVFLRWWLRFLKEPHFPFGRLKRLIGDYLFST